MDKKFMSRQQTKVEATHPGGDCFMTVNGFEIYTATKSRSMTFIHFYTDIQGAFKANALL